MAILTACLLALSACRGPGVRVMPISIVTKDISGAPTTLMTEVTRIDDSGGCEYRLEFKDPSTIEWPIGEVSGNQGPLQRKRFATCPPDSAAPPAFDATAATNAAWFDEQTVYYWTKKSRDYAVSNLWITPPGLEGNAPKFARNQLGPTVLTGPEFGYACVPLDAGHYDGCMRAWPGQTPRIHIETGQVTAELVAHEYGHYAAGFIFGKMDPLTGFDASRCVHRAFQEAIADTFTNLFIHYEQAVLSATPVPSHIRGLSTQWRNACTIDDYLMGVPLLEAYQQSVWGEGMDVMGNPVNVPWSNPAAANSAMASALTFALATAPGFGIHRIAHATVDHIEKNQPGVAPHVRAIFAAHGLVPTSNGAYCTENDECSSGYCDRGDLTSKTSLCMPARGTGTPGNPCTNDNQCESNYCANLSVDRDGMWLPGQCQAKVALGDPCLNSDQCASTYCDRGNSNVCLPRGGAGITNDLCNHDKQCASGNCADAIQDALGRWQLGRCNNKAGLGQFCVNGDLCASGSCDLTTNVCTPRRGAGEVNQLCTQHAQCETGFCADLVLRPGATTIPGHCVAPGGPGKVCSANSDCASTYCDRGLNTKNTNLCLPRSGEGRTGDLCSDDTQCGSRNCAGLIFTSSRHWIPGQCASPVALGQPCLNNDHCQSRYCDHGDHTQGTNRCMPAPGVGVNGSLCTSDTQCISRICNNLRRNSAGDWLPGTCADKFGLGKPCTTNSFCASGWCDHGNNTGHTDRCMPAPAAGIIGQICTQDAQCASGHCGGLTRDRFGNWVPGACAPRGSLGAPCSTNSHCVSTYCDAGHNTGNTNRCMPRGGEGVTNDPCSDNTQCRSGTCNGLIKNADGSLTTGLCL